MRAQMRAFYIGRGAHLVEEFRICRDNGWGPQRWRSTVFLAWDEYRKAVTSGTA